MSWTGAFGRGCGKLLYAIVRGLSLTRISPNILTFTGLVINIIAGVLFGYASGDSQPPANRLHLYGHSTMMQQAELTSSAGGSSEATVQAGERAAVASPASPLSDRSRPYESRGAIAKPAEKRLGYRAPF